MLKVNPRDAATISLIATCEAKLGRRAAAERHAAEAVAIAPASREALVRSARVHVRLNQPDAALKDLEAAIARGYDRRQAREEDEFAAIRDLPAFQKLVSDDGQPRKP
jgi:tetratricopeptide (TPR) repeat protein